MVIVRTYFASDPPQESEKPMLAGRAASMVRKKLEEGWIPEPGSILRVNTVAASPAVVASTKPWWKLW